MSFSLVSFSGSVKISHTQKNVTHSMRVWVACTLIKLTCVWFSLDIVVINIVLLGIARKGENVTFFFFFFFFFSY